jgi:uncharacterized protein YbjQ (UPF0145 family)
MNANDMGNLIELVFKIAVPVVLILVGLFAGRIAERKHLTDLDRREAALKGMIATNMKSFPGADPAAGAALVLGEAVISSDYFKSFLAKIRKIIGGELKSYESLMERGRREAIARMLERARQAGFDAVCNVRIEGVDIAGASKSNGKANVVTSVTLVASGTAYRRRAAAA